MKTKLTDDFTHRLSWYDFYKGTAQILDMTSNKIESHHRSFQLYLGGQSALKQTSFSSSFVAFPR